MSRSIFRLVTIDGVATGGRARTTRCAGWPSEARRLMAAEVSAKGASLEVDAIRPLGIPVITGRVYMYDVSADGQRFLCGRSSGAEVVCAVDAGRALDSVAQEEIALRNRSLWSRLCKSSTDG